MASCRLRRGQSAFWGDSVGRNPTDRGKAGSKRSILVDAGGLLGVVVAGANIHDTKLLAITLDSIVVEQPDTGNQHLCLDKGYDNPAGHQAVSDHGYLGHIRGVGEEKLDASGVTSHPARRWMVERTQDWLSKLGVILVRHDKRASNYVGLIQLAGALISFRRQRQIKL